MQHMRVCEIIVRRDMEAQELQWISHQANLFSSDVMFKYEDLNFQLDAKSILGMMLLPIRRGTKLTVQTRGKDELEALEHLILLLEKQDAPCEQG